MEYKDIRNLAALMKEMGLTALEYSEGGAALKMERAAAVIYAEGETEAAAGTGEIPDGAELTGSSIYTVKSPTVGVFYAAPGSDMKPYVKNGDTVRMGDILCIIEAMKIMNEITAEKDGVIMEICVDNKQVVEFGQPLFRIDTDR